LIPPQRSTNYHLEKTKIKNKVGPGRCHKVKKRILCKNRGELKGPTKEGGKGPIGSNLRWYYPFPERKGKGEEGKNPRGTLMEKNEWSVPRHQREKRNHEKGI